MKISLNTEKSPFCSVGPFSFTFGQEEYNIDIDQLSDDHKRQLFYNINRGVLISNDKDGLAALTKAIQPVTPVPQEQIPINYNKVAKIAKALPKDPIKEDLKPLRALLRNTVATVKKESATYSIGKLRKLLDLEKENKNRKSVISFLTERLEQHEISVLSTIPGKDNGSVHQPDPLARSTQVSDIVESEEEEMTFTQGNLQQTEEGELYLSQGVLNQLEE